MRLITEGHQHEESPASLLMYNLFDLKLFWGAKEYTMQNADPQILLKLITTTSPICIVQLHQSWIQQL
jgi:hypothetical protein